MDLQTTARDIRRPPGLALARSAAESDDFSDLRAGFADCADTRVGDAISSARPSRRPGPAQDARLHGHEMIREDAHRAGDRVRIDAHRLHGAD